LPRGYLLLVTDMKAMIKNATPAQNQLSVRNQTTMAIMAAGRKKRRTLAITMIMIKPITKKINSAMTSNRNGKVGRGRGGIGKVLQQSYSLNYILHLNFKAQRFSKEIQ